MNTTTTSRCFRLALTASLVALATPAMAQITLFEGERFEGRNLSSQRRLPDLERSGQFVAVPPLSGALDETSRPDLAPWRERGADSLLTGSVTRLADGRFDVRFRLWDVVRAQDLGGLSYPVSQADLRLAAHRIAGPAFAQAGLADQRRGRPARHDRQGCGLGRRDARLAALASHLGWQRQPQQHRPRCGLSLY